MNQLHFMLQLADLTLDGRLHDTIRGTWEDLITVSRVIFPVGTSRESAFSWLAHQQESCLGSIACQEAAEGLLAANRELYASLTGVRSTSDNELRSAVFTSLLSPKNSLCNETRRYFEAELLGEQQLWFHTAIRVDQLVRPIPAYHSLCFSTQPPEITPIDSWDWTTSASPPSFETPWLLGRLPARSPGVPPGNLSIRALFADLSECSLGGLTTIDQNVTDSEKLAAVLEAAWLERMAKRLQAPEPKGEVDHLQNLPSFENLNFLDVQVNAHQRLIRRQGRDTEVRLSELHFNVFMEIARTGVEGIEFEELAVRWEELGGRTSFEVRNAVDSALSKINREIRALGLNLSSAVRGKRILVDYS